MVDERLTQFLNALTAATGQKRIQWERTPDPAEYRARLPSGDIVRLVREDLPPVVGGRYPYLALSILDPKGNVIEQWQPLSQDEWNALEEAHRFIRRVAFGVDEKLKSLIEDLQVMVAPHHGAPEKSCG